MIRRCNFSFIALTICWSLAVIPLPMSGRTHAQDVRAQDVRAHDSRAHDGRARDSRVCDARALALVCWSAGVLVCGSVGPLVCLSFLRSGTEEKTAAAAA